MLGMEDLEDDIELVQPAELQVEQPRKLSRLRKGGAEKSPDNVGGVNGTDTPDGDARSSLAGAALLEDDEQSNDEVCITRRIFLTNHHDILVGPDPA